MKVYRIIEKKNLWFFISLTIILAGLLTMGIRFFQGSPVLNFGIDFVGGTTFHLQLPNTNKEKSTQNIRAALIPFDLEKSHIQFTNQNSVFIKTKALEKNITTDLLHALRSHLGNIEVLEVDYIGPSIGKSLRKQAITITLFVTLLLMLYISIRFQLSFGLSSIVALIHDSLIIISLSALFYLEINTTYIAALLTILGYSINDTIVIFDRIREEIETTEESVAPHMINVALTQTFKRTLHTSLTTLLVIVSIILFGGQTIQEFCIILAIGVIAGTYSSVCIASPSILLFEKKRQLEETSV